MPQKLALRRFDDFHCHFRLPPLLEEVLPFTAQYCGRGIAMPNTRPRPILTADDVRWYHDQINSSLGRVFPPVYFRPLLTIEIRDNTTPEMVYDAKKAGAVAGKVYPLGVTTNSDEGLRNFTSSAISNTFREMQEVGMLLLLHGELDKERTLVTRREQTFLPALVRLAEEFPRLKIVLEHISTSVGIEVVEKLGPNVGGTITAHHLLLTLNNVLGSGIEPHHMCMPVPKDFDDRDALIRAATSENQKFFFGSDTAPHTREKKECAKGACGVFSAPVVPSVLTEVFEEAGALDRLQDFTSRFGAEFYGLPLNEGEITLIKEAWTVPEQYGSVVPFMAGKTLRWKLQQ